MRASAHVRTATRSCGRRREVPPSLFHAPLYEAIVHEFESLYDADCAS